MKWFTVVICPWLLTYCRHSSRVPILSRRLYWSFWIRCHSTLVPQKMRCLTLYHVRAARHCVVKLSPSFTPLIDFSCSIFLLPSSDSQLSGYLLYYFQPGHGAACKHMEIRYQVSAPETNYFDITSEWVISVVISITNELVFKIQMIQTEFKVPVIGGGTSSSWWHQQQPLW